MTPFERRRVLEALLTDWFRREGFSVSDGVACSYGFGTYDDGGDPTGGGDAEVPLDRLADFLSDEMEKVLA